MTQTYGTYDITIRLHGETLEAKYNFYPGDEYHPEEAREPVMVTLHGVNILPMLINYSDVIDDIERAILDAEHELYRERTEP